MASASGSEPFVSVLMAAYAEESSWLREAIESILDQTYKNFEFIIILDNPNNNVLKSLLEKYAVIDSRIKFHINSENIGLTRSLNVGLKKCKGSYIVRMDGDDFSIKNRLEKQVLFMENNPNIGVCGTWAEYFGLKNGIQRKEQDNTILKRSMLDVSPFIHPSVIIRKSVLDTNNIEYNINWKFTQDKRLWFDLENVTQFANIPEVLLKYRVSKAQISNRNIVQKELSWAIKMLIIKQYFGESIYSIIFGKEITLKTITQVKKTLSQNSVFRNNRLIINLYLSLNKYDLKSLTYLIGSGDIFLSHILLNEKIKVIKRIFKHDKFNDRLRNVEPLAFPA